MVTKTHKTLALIILDGWGYRTARENNPTQTVDTPIINHLFKDYPHLLLHACGKAVGLPEGQMGNSEVGHLHLGAGRKCLQDLVRIDQDIENGRFEKNAVFINAIKKAKQLNSAIHVIGLVSPGGVHSHENQLLSLIKMIGDHGVTKNYCHAILDGRDTPPRSAQQSLEKLTSLYKSLPGGQIASIMGRYYAMDRDKRWDRTQKAYDCLTGGLSDFTADTAVGALQLAYERDESDEFVQPTDITDNQPITINDNDIVIFMNFRADRARQLTEALTQPNFNGFKRQKIPALLEAITLTQYNDYDNVQVAYPPITIHNTLGECIANAGLSQLRLAETEKYAHVTYFLNGGIETPFKNEDRKMIPSPKVATYDLQPEMSANELTDALIEAIESKQYDFIVCNYANPDMVAHTGNENAAKKAVKVIDDCLGRLLKTDAEFCITADHGNIEQMHDNSNDQPHTAHTTNLVPFIYVGRPADTTQKKGALDDVAPTILYLLGLKQPLDMTGHCLLKLR